METRDQEKESKIERREGSAFSLKNESRSPSDEWNEMGRNETYLDGLLELLELGKGSLDLVEVVESGDLIRVEGFGLERGKKGSEEQRREWRRASA